jgi:hypothetical protein
MIEVTAKGDFNKTSNALSKLLKGNIYADFARYGQMGVNALAKATPVNTGLTQHSWGYRIIKDRNHPGIEWFNTNSVNGTSVAILIQYGHGTGTGGYVQGRDYINPAMHPVFDQIVDNVWEKVRRG